MRQDVHPPLTNAELRPEAERATTTTPSAGPRLTDALTQFQTEVRTLIVQAGKPPLKTIAREGSGPGRKLTVQRISDLYQADRRPPPNFAKFEPMFQWLILRARDRGKTPVSITDLERLWVAARTGVAVPKKQPPVETVPYRGLAALGVNDANLYFGRDTAISELRTEIAAARHTPSKVVIVTGISGVGKSSLVHAGIAHIHEVAPLYVPIRELAAFTLPEPVDDNCVVVVDQFESLFTESAATIDEAMAVLGAVAATGTVVVLAVRADFYEQAQHYPILATGWQHHSVVVAPLTNRQLEDVIKKPLAAVGGSIEQPLADMMIRDVQSSGGSDTSRLPLLAHVLEATWRRRRGSKITLAAYAAAGGVSHAVAETAEAAWHRLDAEQAKTAQLLLLGLVSSDGSGRRLRKALSKDEITTRFPVNANDVIEIFSEARLVSVSADSVTLMHDIVLTAWPRLDDLITRNNEDLALAHRLEEDAHDWDTHGRNSAQLYKGHQLGRALDHRRQQHRRQLALPEPTNSFIAAAERRKWTRFALSLIGVLAVGILLLVLAVVGLVNASDANQQRDAAEYTALLSQIKTLKTSNPSLANQLLLAAHQHRPDDTSVTGQILDAQTQPGATALNGHKSTVYDVKYNRTGSLMASASEDHTGRLWVRTSNGQYRPAGVMGGFSTYLTSVGFDPVAPFLATGAGDGTIRIWNIANPDKPQLVSTQHPGNGVVYIVSFSPDGRQVAAPSQDGSVTLYDTSQPTNPAEAGVIRRHNGDVRTLAYTPGGRYLASGGDDKTVTIDDVSNPHAPTPAGPPLTGFPSTTHGLSFDASGRHLAVTGDGSNSQLWDTSNPAAPHPDATSLPGTTARSWSIVFNPAGTLAAAAQYDGSVIVWDTIDPTHPQVVWTLRNISDQTGALALNTAAFSPDGRTLSVGRADGQISLWHMPDRVIPAHGSGVKDVARGGPVMVTTGGDSTLALWSNADRQWNLQSRIPIEKVSNSHPTVAVRGDGASVATANVSSQHVQVWDTHDPAHPQLAATLPTHTHYTNNVAYTRGGLLVTGQTDTSLQVWDARDPHHITPVGAPLTGPTGSTAYLNRIAVSPDGHNLASGSNDGHIYIWDLTLPTRTSASVLPGTSAAVQDELWLNNATVVVGGNGLSAWDVRAAGRPRLQWREPAGDVPSIAMGPDQTLLAATGSAIHAYRLTDRGIEALPDPVPANQQHSGAATWRMIADPSESAFITGGDSSGALYDVPLSVDAAQRWICTTTDAPSRKTWSQYTSLPYDPPCQRH